MPEVRLNGIEINYVDRGAGDVILLIHNVVADLTTFDGMPRPEGALDLELTGGNTLLDTLVAMGLLPEEQAMGARMMLGLFARPGAGPGFSSGCRRAGCQQGRS